MWAAIVLSIVFVILLAFAFLCGAWCQRNVPHVVRLKDAHPSTSYEVIPQPTASWQGPNGAPAPPPKIGIDHPSGTPMPGPAGMMERGRARRGA